MSNLNKIKELAEARIRTGGFSAFSFREIAKEIGIKSSSVHYHFPTKEDLAAAVARDYSERFMLVINEGSETKSASDALLAYVEAFKQSLEQDQKMCLCGVLAAGHDDLPTSVQEEVARFFKLNLEWLQGQYSRLHEQWSSEQVKQQAVATLAILEGAMLITQATKEKQHFDLALEQVRQLIAQ